MLLNFHEDLPIYEFKILCKSLEFMEFSQIAKNLLFLDPVELFIALRRNRFDSG